MKMKSSQILLGTFLVLLINVCAEAQSIQPGIKFGLNLASIYGDDTEGNKMKGGILVGGILHVPISEQFAFQPELLFIQQGTRGEETGTTISFNNNYLMLPLMGKIYLSPNFVLEVGPQVGVLLSSKLKGEVNGANASIDSKELFKSLDFGLNAGLSYESSNGFVVSTRYCLGLTNVLDREVADVNSKNSAIQVALAYRFLLE
ncbi:porin family protein [Catalinimonas niigatensis]|uniref:porin family protein n=1 Tax=Catalinimonas niigatensis TaxID=1397264 RepID=UPI002664E64F|nr:porin family protein [Catalinimonas niigatensis]WPP48507.1 porin family protein [Catalinimonas niigatensis]